DIDYRSSHRRVETAVKEPPLHSEIVLHRLVIVEVILSQIGKDHGCKLEIIDAMEIDSMRRDLHGSKLTTGIYRRAQNALYLTSLGRRPLCGLQLVSNTSANGREHRRFSMSSTKDRIYKIRSSGLTVSAGNSCQFQLPAWMAIDRCGSQRK